MQSDLRTDSGNEGGRELLQQRPSQQYAKHYDAAANDIAESENTEHVAVMCK